MIPRAEIHLWLGAADASRDILGAYMRAAPAEIRFSRGAFGKPRIEPFKDGAPSFSRSHAARRHLLALSSHEDVNAIGADLVDVAALREMREPSSRDLLHDFFQQVDTAQRSDNDCAALFARLWSQCEALLKASGCGLNAGGIPAACCGVETPEGRWRCVTFNGVIFQLVDFQLDAGFHAAIAVPAGGPLRCLRIFNSGISAAPSELAERHELIGAGAPIR